MSVRAMLVAAAVAAGMAGRLAAQESETPELDFLEYLGSWEAGDEEWLVVAEDARSRDLAGCLFAEQRPGELYLSKIAVSRSARKSGLGANMIAQILPIARQADCAWLTLNVRIALDDNQTIFRRLGFEIFESGSHPGFDAPTFHRMRRPVA